MGADSGITGCTGTGAGLGATATGSTGMGADSGITGCTGTGAGLGATATGSTGMGADSGITGCTGTGAGLGATVTGSTGMGADSSSKEAVYPLESWELLNRLFATSSQLCICCSVTATMSDAPVVMEMDPGLDPGCTGSGWITSGFIGSGSAADAESWDRMESMSSIGAALGASAVGSGLDAPAAAPGEGIANWDRKSS